MDDRGVDKKTSASDFRGFRSVPLMRLVGPKPRALLLAFTRTARAEALSSDSDSSLVSPVSSSSEDEFAMKEGRLDPGRRAFPSPNAYPPFLDTRRSDLPLPL